MISDSPAPSRPALYTLLYPTLVLLGQEVGWVFTIHGSMERDMDVVAIPWHDHAIPEPDLVMEVVRRLGGVPLDPRSRGYAKPHGRVAYIIHLAGGASVDLSVMPRHSKVGG